MSHGKLLLLWELCVFHVGAALLHQCLVGNTLISPLPKWLVQVWCRFEDGAQIQSRVRVLRQVEEMRQVQGQAAKSVCRAGAESGSGSR